MLVLEVIISLLIFRELVSITIGLEKHKYIGGSYDHSIQHFAYLLVYGLGFVLLSIGGPMHDKGMLCVSVGTIFLLYHVYMERAGKFNEQ